MLRGETHNIPSARGANVEYLGGQPCSRCRISYRLHRPLYNLWITSGSCPHMANAPAELLPPASDFGFDRRDADHDRQGGGGAIRAGAADRARASAGAHAAAVEARAAGDRAGAGHRALHGRQQGADRRARAPLPRAQGAVPAVLQPIMQVFESYLGAPQTPTVAGQHVLDAEYFRRIDALNFTHGARRRPAAGGPKHRRHHPARHLAHVENADQHLSGAARLQDGQSAAGAVACRCRSR